MFAPSGASADLARQRAIVGAPRPAFQDRRVVVVYVAGGEAAAELVGKDGGVKLMSASPIAAATLFATIDAMPMRRREMGRE